MKQSGSFSSVQTNSEVYCATNFLSFCLATRSFIRYGRNPFELFF